MGDTFVIPEISMVVLIGPSGSGKSTFAHRHFRETEVLSSDRCRALVSDDETDQTATRAAFDILHRIAAKRLQRARLVVVDATNVKPESRESLLQLARRYHAVPVAIVLDIDREICMERNETRPDRDFGEHVVREHVRDLERSLGSLKKEGFRKVHVLRSPEEVDGVRVVRRRMYPDRREEEGPFDIIGDVHGCFDELLALLVKLGYGVATPETSDSGRFEVDHPEGRTFVLLGDLVDRGPRIVDVLRLAMDAVGDEKAFCVIGNHDDKLMRWLMGHHVKIAHGLEKSIDELEDESEPFREKVLTFLCRRDSHYVFDGGRLVVAHAGLKRGMKGRESPDVRHFALYGETTGEIDEFGLPVRYPWAEHYRGRDRVVYGHTPIAEPEWLNRTINIDTGCVFGGRLTALRYPELELVSVPAGSTYVESKRPFLEEDS